MQQCSNARLTLMVVILDVRYCFLDQRQGLRPPSPPIRHHSIAPESHLRLFRTLPLLRWSSSLESDDNFEDHLHIIFIEPLTPSHQIDCCIVVVLHPRCHQSSTSHVSSFDAASSISTSPSHYLPLIH